jgi:hypothetical protein
MRRAMLEVVAARADTAPATPHDVRRYVLSTLLAAMQDAGPVFEGAKAALRWLGEPRGSPGGRGPGGRGEGLILWDPGAEVFRPTALGLAVLGSGMLVEKALMMEVRCHDGGLAFRGGGGGGGRACSCGVRQRARRSPAFRRHSPWFPRASPFR